MCKAYSTVALLLATLAFLVLPSHSSVAKLIDGGVEMPHPSLPIVRPVQACSDLASVDLGAIAGSGSRVTSAIEISAHGIPTCAVEGVLHPTIGFKVILPTQSWTQRYLQVGCGEFCGLISLNAGAVKGCLPWQVGGFVVASTDMGHQGTGAEFGTDPQKRVDFAYRGVHLTAVAVKKLIRSFYGRSQAYAYFSGCSDGGREALIEAQRYPNDFNGIIAGAPALNFQVQKGLFHSWQAWSNRTADGKAILLASRLTVLHQAAVEACDGLDGLRDGLIQNPLACHFNPRTLLCSGKSSDMAKCLTAAEVEVVRKLYDGPRDPVTGERLTIAGPLFGSELAWEDVSVPRSLDQPTISQIVALSALRYLLFEDKSNPDFSLGSMIFNHATFDRLRSLHPLYDATNPDLSAFAQSGGKLILWHGWADARVSPLNTIAYHDAVQRLMGKERTEMFERMYLFPGMSHCGGGEGPNEIDLLTPMLKWVEKGQPPGAILAFQPGLAAASNSVTPTGQLSPRPVDPTGNKGPASITVQSRLVYPYPYIAAYDGHGDPGQEASYTRGNTLSFQPPTWAGADFFRPYSPRKANY
jgi:Tannase and feruloyl esterase